MCSLFQINKLVLVKFLNDTIVVPRDSEWFGFYADGQDSKLQALEESPLYQEDWLGLKTLNESGRLLMLSCLGNHLQVTVRSITAPPLSLTLSRFQSHAVRVGWPTSTAT